jgi:hypothetical protein
MGEAMGESHLVGVRPVGAGLGDAGRGGGAAGEGEVPGCVDDATLGAGKVACREVAVDHDVDLVESERIGVVQRAATR